MTSSIVRTNPTAGTATTASVRDNFGFAADEITALQRANVDIVSTTGGPVAYSASYPGSPTFSYSDGVRVIARINVTNTTTAPTLAISPVVTGVPIKKADGSDVSIGDLVANGTYEFVYDFQSGEFHCLNLPGNTVTITGAQTITGSKTFSANTDFSAGIDVTGAVDCDGLRMDDGSTASFGNSNDLLVWHSGSQSYVRDNGTGSLNIQTNGDRVSIYDNANTRTMAQFNTNGAANLYWAGSSGSGLKLATTETGIDVTGTVTCDEALTISSDGSGDDAKPDILLYNNATAADGERLGQITYYGKNSATETINYGWHEVKTVDVTDGVEDSVMEFWVRNGAGNHNKSLTLNKDGIDVTGTVNAQSAVVITDPNPRLILKDSSDSDDHAIKFRGSDDVDNLEITSTGNHLNFITADDSKNILMKPNGTTALQVDTTGIDVTGTVKGLNFKHDNSDVTDQSWSSFARNGGANVLYVQQGATDQPIASFRKGSTQAAAGTEVLGVSQDGIEVTGTVTTNEIVFPAYVDDFCSIETNISGSSTNLDFQLGDDNADAFRFRFDHFLDANNYIDALTIKPDSSVGTGDKFIVDVTGTVTADLLTLHPTGSVNEGGQINFQRDIDDSNAWYVDVFGATTDTKMRFVNVDDGLSRLEIDDSGIEVTGDIEVNDNTKGVILKSPDGSRFRLEVANDGTLSTEAL